MELINTSMSQKNVVDLVRDLKINTYTTEYLLVFCQLIQLHGTYMPITNPYDLKLPKAI